MDPIVLICSVTVEAEPLLPRLTEPKLHSETRLSLWSGKIGRRPVLVLVGGMGKTNAASSLTAVLETRPVAGVLGFGVAGAYEGSGLQVGDLALAEVEHYGDEGVATPDGWISCEGIGIPLLQDAARRLYNNFPVDPEDLRAVRRALADRGTPAASGGFVTVSCCSGTAARGRELAQRFGAICETMEGAAYAHVAARYSVPFLELRGVSNLVEDRDPSRWRLSTAAATAADALPTIVTTWNP